MRYLGITLAIFVGCVGGLTAQAQPATEARAAPRRGFWAAVGVGRGTIDANCYACYGGGTGGYSGYLRIGGTPGPHFRLGLEADAWSGSESAPPLTQRRDKSLRAATLVVIWYPWASGALSVKLASGLSRYVQNDPVIGKLTSSQVIGSLGLGWEVRVMRRTSLDLFLDGLAGFPGLFYINGERNFDGRNIKVHLVRAGIGVTWH
jgi:hypothetical protein